MIASRPATDRDAMTAELTDWEEGGGEGEGGGTAGGGSDAGGVREGKDGVEGLGGGGMEPHTGRP